MIDKIVMILQNCMDLPKDVPSSYIETCHGNEVIDIKIEVTDVEKEEDPLLITVPVIKSEHGVSYLSVCTLLG